MKVIMHDSAKAELDDHVSFYEARRDGLGYAVLASYYAKLAMLAQRPMMGPPISGESVERRLRLDGFPIMLVYRVRDGDIEILAVAHTRRRARYWQGR